MGSFRIPFFPPNRAVIAMMDDGVSVHSVGGSASTFLDVISWKASDFDIKLSEAIQKSGASSVLILNDAVEQHYRKERIVVPTAFDKANIIKRRLNVAFPNYPMRAAVELSSKKSTEVDVAQDKSKPYLFAAAPSTETFSRVIRVIKETDCNLFGYALLPLESVGLLNEITKKLQGKRKDLAKASWTILVGQHRGGGLRQIIVRESELALTRVTPVDEPAFGKPEDWAAEVAKEIQATLSYLSRFGYSPDDGLNIIVIGDGRCVDVIDGMIAVPSNFVSLSPAQAGELVGIKLNDGHDTHFSDGLHAAWSGKKISLGIPLSSKEISDIAGPRKIASILMLILSLVFGAILGLSSQEALGLYQNSKNIEISKAQLIEIERIYQEEIKRKEGLGIDVNMIKSSLEINKKITDQRIGILGVLGMIGNDLKNMRMDGLSFTNKLSAIGSVAAPQSTPASVTKAELELKFSFAGNINPEDGNKEMDELSGRLNTTLSPLGYKVKVSEQLKNLTYSGAVDQEVGLTANKRLVTERYNAKILIQKVGNVQNSGK